jgi:Flp pilus assembly protein TadG
VKLIAAIRRSDAERGQAAVEFALILPLLLVLLVAICEFGILFSHYAEVVDASRAGVRKATVERSLGSGTASSDAVAAAKAAAQDLDPSQLQVAVTSPSWAQGDPVTVTASYPYSIGLPGLPVYNGTISSSMTMRLEGGS